MKIRKLAAFVSLSILMFAVLNIAFTEPVTATVVGDYTVEKVEYREGGILLAQENWTDTVIQVHLPDASHPQGFIIRNQTRRCYFGVPPTPRNYMIRSRNVSGQVITVQVYWSWTNESYTYRDSTSLITRVFAGGQYMLAYTTYNHTDVMKLHNPTDPRTPITPVVCSNWTELYPIFSTNWHIDDWTDSGVGNTGKLGKCDDILLRLVGGGQPSQANATGAKEWCHVEAVSWTLLVSPISGPGVPMYIENVTNFNPANPYCSYWHEAWPVWCPMWHFDSYVLDTPPVGPSVCDQIELNGTLWHIDAIGTDLLVTQKQRLPSNHPKIGDATSTTGFAYSTPPLPGVGNDTWHSISMVKGTVNSVPGPYGRVYFCMNMCTIDRDSGRASWSLSSPVLESTIKSTSLEWLGKEEHWLIAVSPCIKLYLSGDVTRDGYIGGIDIGTVGIALFNSYCDPLWSGKCDLTGDGYVGGIDVGTAGIGLFQGC